MDPTDREIVRLMSDGLTVKAIGRHLGLSERTVRRRVRALCDVLEVDTTIELVVWAVRHRLV